LPRWWPVYFRELKNGDIHVGSTDDLRRRFASHQQGHVASTSRYLPVVFRSYVALAYEVTAADLSDTSNRAPARIFAKKRALGTTEWRPVVHEQ
jgi:putative endonuclease